MEIFNEYRNKYYETVYKIIHSIIKSETKDISRIDIKKILVEKNIFSLEFEKSILNENDLASDNYNILIKTSKDRFALTVDNRIPFIPSTVELSWLKYCLSDSKSELYIDAAAREKLSVLLENIDSPVKKEYIQIIDPPVYDYLSTDFIKTFSQYLYALRNKKSIIYSFTKKNGEKVSGSRSIPYKIEYSIKKDCFYGIMYSIDDKRPIKSIIKNMHDIRILENPVTQSDNDILMSIMEKAVNEPLVLKVRDEDNALERAFYLFSCYEKEAIYHSSEKSHELKVYYYQFEEKEVIAKILSLGKNIVVISPESIRTEIVMEIKNSLKIFSI